MAMLTLDALSARPAAFLSLTGLRPDEFEALYADLEPAYRARRAAARATRREGQPRQRKAGAGGRYAHDLRHRLLLALVWLKVYPTYEVLGLLFGLHKRNAQLNARDVLEALEGLGDFPFDRPDRGGRRRLGTLPAVMEAFPAVRLVIDSKEQRVRRPAGPHANQKPYYSGKKRAHTLKTQLAVAPDGLIESLSASVPGSVNDVRLARETGLLGRLGEGEAAMADKGYEGAGKGQAAALIIPKKDRKKNPCSEEDKGRNRAIARCRIVVEHAIAQLSRFTVLRQVYRGGRQRHSQVVRAVAVLANRRIRVRPLKTYPAAG
jgi:DDE superfamily endonuclease